MSRWEPTDEVAKRAIQALLREGVPLRTIAASLGVSVKAVRLVYEGMVAAGTLEARRRGNPAFAKQVGAKRGK